MKTASKRGIRKSRRGWVALGVGSTVLAGGLWLGLQREPLRAQLGLAKAERLSCQPGQDFSASYRLSVSSELKLNAAALLADSHSRGRLLSSSAGYEARL